MNNAPTSAMPGYPWVSVKNGPNVGDIVKNMADLAESDVFGRPV